MLINSDNLQTNLVLRANEESIIKEAAKFLREDILEFCSKLPPLSWPPTIEELSSDVRLPPPSVVLFLTSLLKSPNHKATDRLRRLVSSLSADFVHGISRGSTVTGKHFLLASGTHAMNGDKKVVQTLNRLGHCITYDNLMDIESAQAKKAVKLMEGANTSVLPMKPKNSNDTVLTFFWADNFDKIVDKDTGGGAVNMTTIMAFQEISIGSVKSEENLSVEKSKSRVIEIDFSQSDVHFNDKQEPSETFALNKSSTNNEKLKFLSRYFS